MSFISVCVFAITLYSASAASGITILWLEVCLSCKLNHFFNHFNCCCFFSLCRSVCWKRNEWSKFPRDSISRPLQSLHVFHIQSPIHQQLHGDPRIPHRPGNRPGTAYGCELLRLLNLQPAHALKRRTKLKLAKMCGRRPCCMVFPFYSLSPRC